MKIAAIDTETTSLRWDRRAWDIALVVREQVRVVRSDGPDTYEPYDHEYQWFVNAGDLDLGNADAMSLKIGRFHERHPQYRCTERSEAPMKELGVLREVERATRGAHLIGAVPSFDAEVLANRMRANGICPSWHYHLQDFETLIAGYLRGRDRPVPELPWRSDDLSRAIAVEPPGEDDRHTALGDARWALRVWDAVMGS